MKKLLNLLFVVTFFATGTMSSQEIVKTMHQRQIAAAKLKANYYYLPEIESYYDIRNKKYIYLSNGSWISGSALPSTAKTFNLVNARKIALAEKSKPYANFAIHKAKYHKVHIKKAKPGHRGKALGHRKGEWKKVKKDK